MHKEELNIRRVLHFEQFLGVVSIAQLVEVVDSAVLGGVVESRVRFPRWVIKYFSPHT